MKTIETKDDLQAKIAFYRHELASLERELERGGYNKDNLLRRNILQHKLRVCTERLEGTWRPSHNYGKFLKTEQK